MKEISGMSVKGVLSAVIVQKAKYSLKTSDGSRGLFARMSLNIVDIMHELVGELFVFNNLASVLTFSGRV